VTVPPRSNRRVHVLELGRYLERHGTQSLLLSLELTSGGFSASDNLVHLARPKRIELEEPGIAWRVEQAGAARFQVSLRTLRPALWSWLELKDTEARYSDNFIHLLPGRRVLITVEPSRRLSLAEFRKRMFVRSLRDTYD